MEETNKSSQISSKSRLTALLLGIFLGGLGIHNFYLESIFKGVSKIIMRLLGFIFFAIEYLLNSDYNGIAFYIGLCMIIIPSIWAFVECIIIACGKAKDSTGSFVKKW